MCPYYTFIHPLKFYPSQGVNILVIKKNELEGQSE